MYINKFTHTRYPRLTNNNNAINGWIWFLNVPERAGEVGIVAKLYAAQPVEKEAALPRFSRQMFQ